MDFEYGSGEEIEAAIDSLPPEQFIRIARWFRERDQALWDGQMDSDSHSHRLDFLFDEADDESIRGHPASGRHRSEVHRNASILETVPRSARGFLARVLDGRFTWQSCWKRSIGIPSTGRKALAEATDDHLNAVIAPPPGLPVPGLYGPSADEM
jgi:hypothetical protein